MLKQLTFIPLLLLMVIVVSCSSMTEEEALLGVESAVKKNFSIEKPDSNQETKQYSYFLLSGMKEVNKSKNNIVLEKEDSIFTVFYDQNLQLTDDIYEEEKKKDKEALLFKKISESPTGFVKVINIKNNIYELTIGLGGVKASTTTSKTELLDRAEDLANLVSSFKFKK